MKSFNATLKHAGRGDSKGFYKQVGNFLVPEWVADGLLENEESIGYAPSFIPDVVFWGRPWPDDGEKKAKW